MSCNNDVISGFYILIKRRNNNNNNANVSLKFHSVAIAYVGIYQLCCVMLSQTPLSTAGSILFTPAASAVLRGKQVIMSIHTEAGIIPVHPLQ